MTGVADSTVGHGVVADRFFAAIERGDVDAVADLYPDDVTVWHNYDGLDQTKAESLRTLGWIASHFGPLRYVDVRRIELADGFWQQHVTELTHRGEGHPDPGRAPRLLPVRADRPDRGVRRPGAVRAPRDRGPQRSREPVAARGGECARSGLPAGTPC